MRIALFGGTFNPIHFGHLLLAESAREAFHLDRVIFLPAGIPPHKAAPSIDPRHRWAMIRKAIASNPSFSVSDWEISQKRVVYSMETIEHFREPGRSLFFLIGSDSLRDIEGWLGGHRLLDECQFLVIERPDVPWECLPLSLRRKTRLVPAIPVPYASRDIRRRVAAGLSIRYQVPESAERYIHKHRLYRKEIPTVRNPGLKGTKRI